MPRSYGRRRMSYGRRRYKKRMPNVRQQRFFTPKNIYNAARYAAKGVTLLKGIVNSEVKRHDNILSLTPSSTPGLTLVTNIDQGNDVGNRDGNSILLKYLTFEVDARINSSATATTVRVILFVDSDNDGQTPTAAELLTGSTNTSSPLNVDYTSRFTILSDIKYELSINGDRLKSVKKYIPLHFHQKYITGTGATGFGRNSIWVYYISSEATNVPDVNIWTRVAFYDN